MIKPSLITPPTEVRLRRAKKVLEIVWPDGLRSQLSCLTLRKACSCAGCSRAKQSGALTLIDAEVGIERLEISGISGLQFFFSDSHYRGLYPWAYLRDLSEKLQ
jgi:DUF971 family protein